VNTSCRRNSLLASFILVLVASCSGGSKKGPDPVLDQPDGDGDQPTKPDTTPNVSKRDQARAEVERLKAVADADPLLAPWTGPYGGVPPWDKVSADKFPKVFETSLALMLAEVDVIAENPDPPTFDNTFVAMEDAGRAETRAEVLWGVMTNNLATDEVQKVDAEWSPKIAVAYDKIAFNAKLFARIAAIYDARETSNLTDEQKRLVEVTYDRYVRAGAKLSADEKAKVGKINEELAGLFTEFGKKVLADENTWIEITDEKELAGLSDSLKANYKAAAEERKLAGWAVTNTRSSVDPFLAESTNRALREKVWKAFKSRGDNDNANNTHKVIERIVQLRADRAKLLGYPSHAHWRMADTMAKDPEKAKELMLKVWSASVGRVKEEVADMQKIANKEKAKITIEPWDYLYYAEKVRKAKYDLNQDEIKPYFELSNMIEGAFYMAEQLYGLTFTEISGTVPVFTEGVRVWEVKDKASGQHVALFYGDYFARGTKRSGAWMTDYRSHETFTGTVRTPINSNNNNFVKGAAGTPILISLDDATTLFHEFGHAIHSFVSEVNYPTFGNTPRDFVEYPSQVHEMWVLSKPILDKFARHHKTGKAMPAKLLKKIEASKKFNEGYATTEYLSSAIVDMELHTLSEGVPDIGAFETETLAKIGNPKEVAMRHRLPQFNHLFTSDSYSAGYYSYLWSAVMDADTRKAFEEKGNVFDPETAAKMRKFILAPGNSTDRTEAYRQFRGRDPDVTALLEVRGFPTGKKAATKKSK
jgi:peptidyl-dipeptidase Dcp